MIRWFDDGDDGYKEEKDNDHDDVTSIIIQTYNPVIWSSGDYDDDDDDVGDDHNDEDGDNDDVDDDDNDEDGDNDDDDDDDTHVSETNVIDKGKKAIKRRRGQRENEQ